jgi:hypothetical protein
MKNRKIFLIIFSLFSIIISAALVFSKDYRSNLNVTNQDPQYLIEARKNVIGVWYDVESPLDVVEFTQDGTIIYRNKELKTEKDQNGTIIFRNHDLPEGRAKYKIVNTTPICGSNFYVNESEKTMFLVETDDDGFESCYYFWIGVDDNNKPAMEISGVGANGNSHRAFRKK